MITSAKALSLAFLAIGIFVLMQVGLPLISFQIWEIGQKYNNQILSSPKLNQNQVLGVSLQTINNFPAFVSTKKRESLPYSEFHLTITRINLQETNVYVDSNDLSKGLVDLPGAALPVPRKSLKP